MNRIERPSMPFSSYKWRWAALTPTESLNIPSIYIGALRVFLKYDNHAPSSPEVQQGLAVVQCETSSPVDLARSTDRNLLRNSGQYWSALRLLDNRHGAIHVTRFGRDLCEGNISQTEFATTVIKTLELPNRHIMSGKECGMWDAAGLKIKPLQLILEILSDLDRTSGSGSAYITNDELVKVVIPLAGSKSPLPDHIEALQEYRSGRLDTSGWPDCAPLSNDRRMAREFLLFLANYGFCRIAGNDNQTQRFVLTGISAEEVDELKCIALDSGADIYNVSKIVRESGIPAQIERKKTARMVLERPYQERFRENVLEAYGNRCLITGVSLGCVLEAAHIIPVSYQGNDLIENGICLRLDIHQLFDSGHIRITPAGELLLSDEVRRRGDYHSLPARVTLPVFVNPGNLEWRLKYT